MFILKSNKLKYNLHQYTKTFLLKYAPETMSAILSGHECVNILLNAIYINSDPIHWLILMPWLTIYFFRSHAWPDSLASCFVRLCIKAWIWWYCFRKNHRQKASILKQIHAYSTKEQKRHGFCTLLQTPKCPKWLQNRKPIGAAFSHRYYQSLKAHCYYQFGTPQISPKLQGKTIQCTVLPIDVVWIVLPCT